MLLTVLSRRKVLAAAAIAVGLLLYVLGVRFALVPILLVANTFLLPMPAILGSWLSRVVLAFLVTMSLLQLGGALQFLLFPGSDFRTLAMITGGAQLALLALAPRPTLPPSTRFIDKRDCCGLLAAAFFLLPFSPILAGRNSATRIAEIGGLQAVDGPNHYGSIEAMAAEQHLDYAVGSYYPKGFHQASAFVENTVLDNQIQLGWQGNAFLYFFDYMFYGSLLAYLLFYLCTAWLGELVRKQPGWLPVITALCLGPPLSLLYLIPWVDLGFLSYYYSAATIAGSLLYLAEVSRQHDGRTPVFEAAETRWCVLASLVLLYGVGMSWTLLLPPAVLSVLLFVLPPSLHPTALTRALLTRHAIPVVALLALLLLPIYFQLKYSAVNPAQGINTPGGLHGLHILVLLVGSTTLGLLVVSRRVTGALKRMLINIFVPLLVLVALILAEEYFAVGEVRYYGIKTALFAEVLLLTIGVAALLFVYAEVTKSGLKYALTLPAITTSLMILLVSTVANPLQETRDLFRGHSGSPKPQFFDKDVRAYVRLGLNGSLNQFNSTSLHYDPVKQLFYAHMQIPFWADMMQYQVEGGGFPALLCISRVYDNLAFGVFTAQSQQGLISTVQECATLAHEHRRTFYVVTDGASAPFIRQALGDSVELVY